jgi:hypothetical protein
MTNLHDRTARLREAVVPGRLAEAMPDWLTEAVRPKPAPVPWGAMVRAALAICVPLSVGIVAHQHPTRNWDNICAVDFGLAEDLGVYRPPNPPRNPNLPRSFGLGG